MNKRCESRRKRRIRVNFSLTPLYSYINAVHQSFMDFVCQQHAKYIRNITKCIFVVVSIRSQE